jgi:ribonuclease HIII
MIKDEEAIKKIVEEIKKSMNLEELDELERQYNEMYQRLKSQQSGSNDEPMFGNH